MSFKTNDIEAARRHLRKADPVLRGLIDRVGPFTLKTQRSRFRMLVRSIVSQQISTAAARSIRARLEQLVAPEPLTPENMSRLTLAQMRSAGISPQKASYLMDLAERVASGRTRLTGMARMTDEEIIEELTQIRGIGRWTAQMFLIFCLGRLDVFPHDDLGVRKAIRDLYKLAEMPDKIKSHAIAERWRPYASVASWYCWRSLDVAKTVKTSADEYPC